MYLVSQIKQDMFSFENNAIFCQQLKNIITDSPCHVSAQGVTSHQACQIQTIDIGSIKIDNQERMTALCSFIFLAKGLGKRNLSPERNVMDVFQLFGTFGM